MMKSFSRQVYKLLKFIGALGVALGAFKTVWDLWKGEPGVFTVILAVFFLGIALAFCLYVALSRQVSVVEPRGTNWRFPRWRRIAWMGAIMTACISVAVTYLIYDAAKTRPTPQDKVGIGVARIRFDDKDASSQRGIIEKIQYFLKQESILGEIVEVRPLPLEIAGNASEEQERNALKLGAKYNAAIVVWGTVAGELQQRELYPRLTLTRQCTFTYKVLGTPHMKPPLTGNWTASRNRTIALSVVTEETRRQEQYTLGLPPEHIALVPERVREPVQLARLIVGLALLQRGQCEQARKYLERFGTRGESRGFFGEADALFFLGEAYLCGDRETHTQVELEMAKDLFSAAASRYAQQREWMRYAFAQINVGATFLLLAQQGLDPRGNARRAIETLEDAAGRLPTNQAGGVYSNLALSHLLHVEHGADPTGELEKAVDALTRASDVSSKSGNLMQYAALKGLQGYLLAAISRRAGHGAPDLEAAERAFTEAASVYRKQKAWDRCALVLVGRGHAHVRLAELGIDREKNFGEVEKVIGEVSQLLEQHSEEPALDFLRAELGELYVELAESGASSVKNLKEAVRLLEKRAESDEAKTDRFSYVSILTVLGRANVELAERGGGAQFAQKAVSVLEEVARLERTPTRNVLNQLGRAYLNLAQWNVDAKGNLEKARATLERTVQLGSRNGAALANLGATLVRLAGEGIEARSNLRRAVSVLEQAAEIRRAEQNWYRYGLVQNLLGGAHLKLAEKGVDPLANITAAVHAFENAKKSVPTGTHLYAGIMHNLGGVHAALAERGVEPRDNVKRAIAALEEAARLFAGEKNVALFAAANVELGHALLTAAKYEADRIKLLQRAKAVFATALDASLAAGHSEYAARALLGLSDVLCSLINGGVDVEENRRLLEKIPYDKSKSCRPIMK